MANTHKKKPVVAGYCLLTQLSFPPELTFFNVLLYSSYPLLRFY